MKAEAQPTRDVNRDSGTASANRFGSGDLLGGFVMRTTRVAVMPKGEPLFSEQCTIIEIEDESGGEYLKVRQQSGCADSENQTIAINPEEWPALKNAVEFMLGEIASNPPNAPAEPSRTDDAQ